MQKIPRALLYVDALRFVSLKVISSDLIESVMLYMTLGILSSFFRLYLYFILMRRLLLLIMCQLIAVKDLSSQQFHLRRVIEHVCMCEK